MSGEIGSLLGVGPKGITGSKIGNAIGGYLFDPANGSGLFGKNQGPGAFMNPNGQGGALYPGGPGLPGGNSTGKGLNDAAGVIAGGELAGPALAGGGASSAGAAGSGAAAAPTGAGILSPGASGGGGVAGWLSNANPWSPGYATGHALSSNPSLAGITPNMVIPGGSTMPAATGATAAAAAPASGGGSALNNAAQVAQIAQQMGVGKNGGQQASPLAPAPPRTPVQQGAAPTPPVANPQPQSPGALSAPQTQSRNSPELQQLLAQLGISAHA